jgi:hypothetical protein
MLFTFIVAALLQASNPNEASHFFSHFHGEQWEFAVTQKALDASPSWADDADSPPLPPRSASRVAAQELQDLGLDASAWRVNQIILQQTGRTARKFVYLVEFTERPPSSSVEYLSVTCRIPVLMDGTTVRPIREPWPRR